jgi:monothiol glutaredoxin
MSKSQQERQPMTASAGIDDTHARIAETVERHPVVLFMKGSPERPQCGFSAAVVDVLRHYDVPVHAVDVLRDPALRQGIKDFSDWPTVPQLYVDGVFVGGADIVREMHRAGELAALFAAPRREARP